jgi:uncharacterized protein (DUF952 family)
MEDNNVYKVLRANEWEEASRTGLIVTELDVEDGFVHLSTAIQLAATLSLYFKGSDKVILLELDIKRIDKDKFVFEEPHSNNAARKSAFPHLYSELTTKQISNVWFLERGAFILPEEVLLQSENPTTN